MAFQHVDVDCRCGAELTVTNFPVDCNGLTKKEVIELSRYYLLQSCPKCDPKFTGEVLHFILKELE